MRLGLQFKQSPDWLVAWTKSKYIKPCLQPVNYTNFTRPPDFIMS